MTTVYFIGAGPGDPELLTIKGKRIIDKADIVIYAGSLVNKEILADCKDECKIYNSAVMNLEQITALMIKEKDTNKIIARVHTGDPSLYGAIKEQIDILKENDMCFKVIPGVSSFSAAAAALTTEYTLPGISQTLICTRMSGRTLVPEREELSALARHTSSMAIFLSIGLIDRAVKELLSGYHENTPCAIVYKVSWQDEKIVRCVLKNAAVTVKDNNITKHALFLVGDFLTGEYKRSQLYNKTFSHEYRSAQ